MPLYEDEAWESRVAVREDEDPRPVLASCTGCGQPLHVGDGAWETVWKVPTPVGVKVRRDYLCDGCHKAGEGL